METIVIIGAGPAGLTAAFELLERPKRRAGEAPERRVIVLEAEDDVGGISRTFNHNGNRIDIGGHRFFSKSDRVMEWWLRMLPIDPAADAAAVSYHGRTRTVLPQGRPHDRDDVMLVRSRRSRIFHRRRFFNYPLSLSSDTLSNLGLARTFKVGLSYLKSRLSPIALERSLEDFIVNRFGRYLYETFFRDYTEKVWGVPCSAIPADWGRQRIKGVSISSAVAAALRKQFGRADRSVSQRNTETSLIERFLYPTFGPGHMWARTAEEVRARGGEVRLRCKAVRLHTISNAGSGGESEARVAAVTVRDVVTGEETQIDADWVISTMPVRELMESLDPPPPPSVALVSDGLLYRDFMTVGLLCDRLKLAGGVTGRELSQKLPDTWIYIQEPDVSLGRLQIFNNWSPSLVADPDKVWLGLEYFLSDADPLWNMDDQAIRGFAVAELEKLGIVDSAAVLDHTVIRMPKAYPAYFGSYPDFGIVRNYTDGLGNLFLVGRNGMHRYNNQDHSMLTAMAAVDLIEAGGGDKAPIWEINTEETYHEAK